MSKIFNFFKSLFSSSESKETKPEVKAPETGTVNHWLGDKVELIYDGKFNVGAVCGEVECCNGDCGGKTEAVEEKSKPKRKAPVKKKPVAKDAVKKEPVKKAPAKKKPATTKKDKE